MTFLQFLYERQQDRILPYQPKGTLVPSALTWFFGRGRKGSNLLQRLLPPHCFERQTMTHAANRLLSHPLDQLQNLLLRRLLRLRWLRGFLRVGSEPVLQFIPEDLFLLRSQFHPAHQVMVQLSPLIVIPLHLLPPRFFSPHPRRAGCMESLYNTKSVTNLPFNLLHQTKDIPSLDAFCLGKPSFSSGSILSILLTPTMDLFPIEFVTRFPISDRLEVL